MYRPLPEYLTIQPSKIEGLGLFTLADLEKGKMLGITHVEDVLTGKLIRTPLGGFINHLDNPNLERYEVQRYHYIRTLKDIALGQELTLKYRLYNL